MTVETLLSIELDIEQIEEFELSVSAAIEIATRFERYDVANKLQKCRYSLRRELSQLKHNKERLEFRAAVKSDDAS